MWKFIWRKKYSSRYTCRPIGDTVRCRWKNYVWRKMFQRKCVNIVGYICDGQPYISRHI